MLPGQQVERDAEWARGKVGSFFRLLLSSLGHRLFPHLGWGIRLPVRIPGARQLSPGALRGRRVITV